MCVHLIKRRPHTDAAPVPIQFEYITITVFGPRTKRSLKLFARHKRPRDYAKIRHSRSHRDTMPLFIRQLISKCHNKLSGPAGATRARSRNKSQSPQHTYCIAGAGSIHAMRPTERPTGRPSDRPIWLARCLRVVWALLLAAEHTAHVHDCVHSCCQRQQHSVLGVGWWGGFTPLAQMYV